MDLFLHFLVLLLVTFLLLLIQKISKNKTTKAKFQHPPGPPGLPVIGNLHQCVTPSLHLYFHELSKTYGPLISLKLGFRPTLVVSSAKMAKEVMKTHDHVFSSRPKLANQQPFYNGLGMALSPYGDYWREMRKICHVHFFNPKKVESFSLIREEEVYQMTRQIACHKEPVNLSEMIICLTNTMLCRVAFGWREEDGGNDIDRFRISSLSYMLRTLQELLVSVSFCDFLPFMSWIDKVRGLMNPQYRKVLMDLDRFLEEIIDGHVKKIEANDGEEDIVDVLLRVQQDKSFGLDITRYHIKAILTDLLLAGTDTSVATIIWAMTELVKNPKAMKQVQKEARTTMIGNNPKSMIKEEHIEKLVYLKAVVKETLRMHPSVPLLLPREANQSCTINGYEIHEKTLVYISAYAIGRDPESWKNPDEFTPERFLGSKSKDFGGQDFELIPFGSGRRVCPGIYMGVTMVELVLANLLFLFDWDVPHGMEKDILDTTCSTGISILKKVPLCLTATNVCKSVV